MKYFDKNKYSGKELIELHNDLGKSVHAVKSNLFFHETFEQADSSDMCETLARSAYRTIAVLEAVIDRVPQEEREKALADTREHVSMTNDEIAGKLAELLVGAIFVMGD